MVKLSLSKEEFVVLGLPDWESMALGGPNNSSFLRAWLAYQQYENARLRLELLEARGEVTEEARSALEAGMATYRKTIVNYLNTPEAD